MNRKAQRFHPNWEGGRQPGEKQSLEPALEFLLRGSRLSSVTKRQKLECACAVVNSTDMPLLFSSCEDDTEAEAEADPKYYQSSLYLFTKPISESPEALSHPLS